MHFRRFVLGAIAALPMLSLAPLARAQVPPDTAKTFIRNAGDKLVAVVNGSGSHAQKAQALQTLVNQIVAVDTVGNYVLGRYRNVLSPQQHQEFLSLFHQLLSYNITYQIRAYEGVTFTVNGTSEMGGDTLVDTTITRPGEAPADVKWAVQDVGGQPKIVDVIVAGTSLRITTRNDYTSVITSHGGQVSALLDAMKSQISRIKSSG